MTKDLFGNMPEPAKPDDAHEPFKFTELERKAICDKISDFADVILVLADKKDIDTHIPVIVKEIEDLIAQEVEQA